VPAFEDLSAALVPLLSALFVVAHFDCHFFLSFFSIDNQHIFSRQRSRTEAALARFQIEGILFKEERGGNVSGENRRSENENLMKKEMETFSQVKPS
jgi:hypothetical protein